MAATTIWHMQPTMAATLLLSAPPLRGSRKPLEPDLQRWAEQAGAGRHCQERWQDFPGGQGSRVCQAGRVHQLGRARQVGGVRPVGGSHPQPCIYSARLSSYATSLPPTCGGSPRARQQAPWRSPPRVRGSVARRGEWAAAARCRAQDRGVGRAEAQGKTGSMSRGRGRGRGRGAPGHEPRRGVRCLPPQNTRGRGAAGLWVSLWVRGWYLAPGAPAQGGPSWRAGEGRRGPTWAARRARSPRGSGGQQGLHGGREEERRAWRRGGTSRASCHPRLI